MSAETVTKRSQVLATWKDPKPDEIAETAEAFLEQLDGATAVFQHGRQAGVRRAVVTLLHGNEPSGFRACHRWLKEGHQPLYDTLLIIASVHAAKQSPLFSQRHLVHERDLNRCFRAPFDIDEQGVLASEILAMLENFAPECVVDLHNTSGDGPSFSVSIELNSQQMALASLFTGRLILTDLRLGAIMECSSVERPMITIECGGAKESKADNVAYKGLQRLLTQPNVLSLECRETGLEIFTTPVRVELKSGVTLAYGGSLPIGMDIVLDEDIERFNFQEVREDMTVGFVGSRGLGALVAHNAEGRNVIADLFRIESGRLMPARPLKLFMATANATVAKSDCLFYAVCAKGE